MSSRIMPPSSFSHLAVLCLAGSSSSLLAQTWKPVEGHIMTRWTKQVSPANPLPEYRRPISYYRNILWKRGERLYLAVKQPAPPAKEIVVTRWGLPPSSPSWTWPGHEGQQLEVDAYSNADHVRLFLNDRQIGEMPTGMGQEFKATFPVPYKPGTLKAVATEGGRPVAESVLRTAGTAARIKLTADRATFVPMGRICSLSPWRWWTRRANCRRTPRTKSTFRSADRARLRVSGMPI